MLFMSLFFLLASCQEEELAGSGVGYLRLQLDVNTTVNTKAGYDPMQIAAQIVNAAGQVVKETADWTDWEGESIALEPGSYTLKASSNGFDGQERAFEKPYYAGSKTFSIEQGKANAVSLTCTLANVKVSVNFGDGFAKYFTEATVTVSPLSSASEGTETTNEAATGLVFDMGRPDQGSGYFPVSDLQAILVAKNLKGATIRQTDKMEGVAARDHHILNYSISGGDGEITITVNDRTQEHVYEVGVNPIPTTTLMPPVVNAWSRMAYVDAQAVPNQEGEPLDDTKMKIQYRQKGTDVWTDAVTTAGEENTYQATIGSLTANTAYECRTSYNNEQFTSEVSSFMTEAETALYNGDFEFWSKSGETIYPDIQANAGNTTSFWNTSNPGTTQGMGAIGGALNPTTSVTSPVHTQDGKAAQLKSAFKIIAFAAASLYTGNFAGLSGMSANMEFGKPFSGRPIALKGYYKYTPTVINHVDRVPDGVTIEEGKTMDECSIFIALAKKSFTFNNNDESTYIDYEGDDNIIAYGALPSGAATQGDGYTEFTIPLKYKNLTEKPTHIIVVCSASKYGDYMTGGEGSTLYVDDFSLVYEGTPTLWE